jgi:hypothetical protein
MRRMMTTIGDPISMLVASLFVAESSISIQCMNWRSQDGVHLLIVDTMLICGICHFLFCRFQLVTKTYSRRKVALSIPLKVLSKGTRTRVDHRDSRKEYLCKSRLNSLQPFLKAFTVTLPTVRQFRDIALALYTWQRISYVQ